MTYSRQTSSADVTLDGRGSGRRVQRSEIPAGKNMSITALRRDGVEPRSE